MNDNYFIKEIDKIVKKLLPKFIEKYESKHNFKLPEIEITSIEGYVRNIWEIVRGDETSPIFMYVGVKLLVDVKDSRMGIVKKMIKSLVESTLDSLSYYYDEIIIDISKSTKKQV